MYKVFNGDLLVNVKFIFIMLKSTIAYVEVIDNYKNLSIHVIPAKYAYNVTEEFSPIKFLLP
jgi:hypothetical protein